MRSNSRVSHFSPVDRNVLTQYGSADQNNLWGFFFFFGYILAKWGSVALGHCTHGYCCTVLCMTMHIIGYLHLPHPSLVSTALDWPMFFCTQPWLPLLSTLCAISLNDHLRFYRL